MSSLKKIKKRFGRLKKLPYLCKTKSEIKSEKKIEKRFGRLKNSSYLCETKKNGRFVYWIGRISFQKSNRGSNPLPTTNMARSSTGLARETDLSV
jgi:hypothetical protein